MCSFLPALTLRAKTTYSWYVSSLDKFYFRFRMAKDRLMVPLAKTINGYIVAICKTFLLVYGRKQKFHRVFPIRDLSKTANEVQLDTSIFEQ